MKNWPIEVWIVFLGLIVFLAVIILYVFFLYYTIGYLTLYVGILGLIIGYFIVMSKVYAGRYHLHFHHYMIGMVGVTLMCY